MGESEESITLFQLGTTNTSFNENEIFSVGEKYILFLKETIDDNRADYWIQGEELGIYKIEGNVLERKVEDEELESNEVFNSRSLDENNAKQFLNREEFFKLVEEMKGFNKDE